MNTIKYVVGQWILQSLLELQELWWDYADYQSMVLHIMNMAKTQLHIRNSSNLELASIEDVLEVMVRCKNSMEARGYIHNKLLKKGHISNVPKYQFTMLINLHCTQRRCSNTLALVKSDKNWGIE